MLTLIVLKHALLTYMTLSGLSTIHLVDIIYNSRTNQTLFRYLLQNTSGYNARPVADNCVAITSELFIVPVQVNAYRTETMSHARCVLSLSTVDGTRLTAWLIYRYPSRHSFNTSQFPGVVTAPCNTLFMFDMRAWIELFTRCPRRNVKTEHNCKVSGCFRIPTKHNNYDLFWLQIYFLLKKYD